MTFREFIESKPEYQPFAGQPMHDVYRMEHEAFVAYVDEVVVPELHKRAGPSQARLLAESFA